MSFQPVHSLLFSDLYNKFFIRLCDICFSWFTGELKVFAKYMEGVHVFNKSPAFDILRRRFCCCHPWLVCMFVCWHFLTTGKHSLCCNCCISQWRTKRISGTILPWFWLSRGGLRKAEVHGERVVGGSHLYKGAYPRRVCNLLKHP